MTIGSKAGAAVLVVACMFGLASFGHSADKLSADELVKFAEAGRPAPNFVGISNWLNSGPLSITDLRGKVVLVDFWTYGCINCVNTLPQVTRLYQAYRDKGLVVVGVHTPEFPFEKATGNVQAALKRHGIPQVAGPAFIRLARHGRWLAVEHAHVTLDHRTRPNQFAILCVPRLDASDDAERSS